MGGARAAGRGLTGGAETIAEYLDAHRGQAGPPRRTTSTSTASTSSTRRLECSRRCPPLSSSGFSWRRWTHSATGSTRGSPRLRPTSSATCAAPGSVRSGLAPTAASGRSRPHRRGRLCRRRAPAAVTDLDAAWQTRHPGEQAPSSPLEPRGESGGFIHAPSASQAATAAVLRSGYLENLDSTDGAQLAIDLSSDRVRTAMYLLDGVREGSRSARCSDTDSSGRSTRAARTDTSRTSATDSRSWRTS